MNPHRCLRAALVALLALPAFAVVPAAADEAQSTASAQADVDAEFWRGIELNERRRRIIEGVIREGAVLAQLERVIVEIVGPPLAPGPRGDGGADKADVDPQVASRPEADIASAAEGYRTAIAILRRYAQGASATDASAERKQVEQGQAVHALLEDMVVIDVTTGKTPPAEAREGVRRLASSLADHYARDFCDRLVRSRVEALLPARGASRHEHKRALRALDAEIAAFEAGRGPKTPGAPGAVLAAEAMAACQAVGLTDPREKIAQALRSAVDLERMWLDVQRR